MRKQHVLSGKAQSDGLTTMSKHARTFLLIINVVVILFLFSQKLYAEALHFIAYGDTRQDIKTVEMPQVKHNAIARVIRDMSPDFILFSGDMVCRTEFERFREVITNNYTGDKMIPLYPVIGNHDIVLSGEVNIMLKDLFKKMGVFDEPKEEEKLRVRSWQVLCEDICGKLDPAYISYLKEVLCETADGRSWYSFFKEVNGLKIKFVAMNSSLPDDEEQFQWFLGELEQFHGPKIVFEHYPIYSTGFHGCIELLNSNSRASRFRDRYSKIFNDTTNNILLVISGHEHSYQRICKTDKQGGIQFPVYLVSGGGGARLRGQGECDVSEISCDGFVCRELTTAYHFVDILVNIGDKNNLILKCKVLGLRFDLEKGLPDDDTVEKQFVKDRLELIDTFTLNWRNN